PLFNKHGIAVEPAIWNDDSVNWKAYDGVLIRSVWDYHLHIKAFGQWLDKLEAQQVPMLNPFDTIQPNLNKLYLRGLEKKGVEIVPTLFFDKTASLNLSVAARHGWQNMVIKPAVSASAYLTRVFDVKQLAEIEEEFKSVAAKCELLVQPFME